MFGKPPMKKKTVFEYMGQGGGQEEGSQVVMLNSSNTAPKTQKGQKFIIKRCASKPQLGGAKQNSGYNSQGGLPDHQSISSNNTQRMNVMNLDIADISQTQNSSRAYLAKQQ